MLYKLLINYFIGISVILAAIIGLVKYKQITESNKPIIWIWWALVLNETIRFVLLLNHISTSASYNIGFLLITVLYLFQFKTWNTINLRVLIFLASTLLIVWVTDHFFLAGLNIHNTTYWNRICGYVILVVLAISTINNLMIRLKGSLLKNHIFLISITLAIYNTYKVLILSFILSEVNNPSKLKSSNFDRYLVIFSYSIYLYAAICLPKKKTFIQAL